MKFLQAAVLFLICLLAGITVSNVAHELIHVVQLSGQEHVKPTSMCMDFGQESMAHVSFVWKGPKDVYENFEKQNTSREFVAYSVGFITLGFFMIITKVRNYW